MGKTLLIGVQGAAGAGKDTFWLAVQQLTGKRSCRIAFGDAIKRIAKGMGWNGVKDAKGRALLQRLGTECMRECISPMGWISLTNREDVQPLLTSDTPPDVIVCTDVRFQNELDYIQLMGGIAVKVVGRQKYEPSWFDKILHFLRVKEHPALHLSETQLKGWVPGDPGHIFDNSHDKMSLLLQVREFLVANGVAVDTLRSSEEFGPVPMEPQCKDTST